MSARDLSNSDAKCDAMPGAEPYFSLPGLALAYCTNSPSVFAATLGPTTMTTASLAIDATAVNDLTGS